MSLYRRNNRSSEPCSAVTLVVPAALEYEKPAGSEGIPAHTTSCGCKTVWWNPSLVGVQAESNPSLVSVWLPVAEVEHGKRKRRYLLNIHHELRNNCFGAKFNTVGASDCDHGDRVATGAGCNLIGPSSVAVLAPAGKVAQK